MRGGSNKKFQKTVPASLNTLLIQSLVPIKRLKEQQIDKPNGALSDYSVSPPPSNVHKADESESKNSPDAVGGHPIMMAGSASVSPDKLPPTIPYKSTTPNNKNSSKKKLATPNRWSKVLAGVVERSKKSQEIGAARLEKKIQTQLDADFSPKSSCDADDAPVEITTAVVPAGGGVNLLGTIVSAARKVDREREMHLMRGSRGGCGASDSGSTGTGDTDDSDTNTKQRRMLGELRLQAKALKREVRRIQNEKDDMKKQLDTERKQNNVKLEEVTKQVEERNLKLAVLEQHFIALNDQTTQRCDSFDFSKDVSYDSGGESLEDESLTHKSGSIIQLDKSYFSDLKNSLKESKAELLEINKDKKHSSIVKAEMMKEIEDLTEKLRCREQTISSLEISLKQTRATRFRQKVKTHKRRATANDLPTMIEVEDDGSSSVNQTEIQPPQTGNNTHRRSSTLGHLPTTSEIGENVTSFVKTDQTISSTKEESMADDLKTAFEAKEKEHAASMAAMEKQLRMKEKLVKKLETKIDNMKTSRPQLESSQLLLLRSTSMNSELMDTSTRRLQTMLKNLDESVEDTGDSGIDIPDEMAPIRRVASKIFLVNDEVKISMKLIEQKMLNAFEAINKDKVVVNEGSQSKSEEKERSTPNTTKLITEAQAQSMKMLQETESSINMSLDVLKEKLRDVESEMESKQDMIEALELACSEHDRNCRSLQEQMSALVLRLEAEADNVGNPSENCQ